MKPRPVFRSLLFTDMLMDTRTYDEYTSELTSGHLSWTPVHDSELFWKENATKLNDKNYEQLRSDITLFFCDGVNRISNGGTQDTDPSIERIGQSDSASGSGTRSRTIRQALRTG